MLISNEINTFSHKCLSSEFAKAFIKTNKIEPLYGKILSNIFQKRQLGDYDMYAEITESMAIEVLKDASKFIDRMVEYLKEHKIV
jgi:uncharacterized protein (UPF0332 family)